MEMARSPEASYVGCLGPPPSVVRRKRSGSSLRAASAAARAGPAQPRPRPGQWKTTTRQRVRGDPRAGRARRNTLQSERNKRYAQKLGWRNPLIEQLESAYGKCRMLFSMENSHIRR